MQSVTDEYEIVGIPIGEVDGKVDDYYRDQFGLYRHLFLLPRLRRLADFAEFKGKVSLLPSIHFEGYHPDSVYVTKNGKLTDSPMGGYHSCIIFAAFSTGRTEEETAGLFREDFFRAAGYFKHWQAAKAALFTHSKEVGFPVEDHFYRWCAEGTFMHTINHPKIRVLIDVGLDALRRIGCTANGDPDSVADQLSNAPVYPVYPELAAAIGAKGSYRFKPFGTNETLSLGDYIKLSFESYRSAGEAELKIYEQHLARYNAVSALIQQH